MSAAPGKDAAPAKTTTPSKTFAAFAEAAGLGIRDMRGWPVDPLVATRAFEVAIAAGDPQRRMPYSVALESFDKRFVEAAHAHAHEALFDEDDIAARHPHAAARTTQLRQAHAASRYTRYTRYTRPAEERHAPTPRGVGEAALAFDDATVHVALRCGPSHLGNASLSLVAPGTVAQKRSTRGTAVPASSAPPHGRFLEGFGGGAGQRIAGSAASWEGADGLVGLLASCAPELVERADPAVGGAGRAGTLVLMAGTDFGSYIMAIREGSTWMSLDPHPDDVPAWFREAVQVLEARYQVAGGGTDTHFVHALPGGASATLEASRKKLLEGRRRDLAKRLMALGAPRGGALAAILRAGNHPEGSRP